MVMTWPGRVVSIVIIRKGCQMELTVDPATVLGSEEGNHASNVLWHGAALERAVLSHEFLDLVRRPVWGAAWDVVL